MSFRREKHEVREKRRWTKFLADNSRLIEQIGLPETVTETEDRFVDFLMHGYIDHHNDPVKYTIRKMNEDEHRLFKKLLKNYGDAGLMKEDELAMHARYLVP